MAVNASRVWARKPAGSVLPRRPLLLSTTRLGRLPSPGNSHSASAPIATKASSFTSDSSAIASTMPRWCSVASMRRVPNRIANTASISAMYSAGSLYHSAPSGLPLSTPTLMPTALNCRAKYGIAATTAITATVAASPRARP